MINLLNNLFYILFNKNKTMGTNIETCARVTQTCVKFTAFIGMILIDTVVIVVVLAPVSVVELAINKDVEASQKTLKTSNEITTR
jgi:hypothetical protein